MPEIFLRAYGREIDELVERERLDEAIAHCRYILQTYPKHLDTYRHLGKAYLEAKRYGDAADIFQRVLSAVPDDFVSHVGMAIVREDEGNLDAAIWHMERAFETNPSNPAIQQEMKRLISRRDGLEPHKVRLTRGALARMYAHGELFTQAIAELRSALQEDAERPDLQVLLASMYWQTDQRSDATSVSNQILEKLPYCAEANRILAANLQASDRVEEAAVYHRRLANLDPYAAFVESALADATSVEESAVSLEKLDWVAGEPLPSAAPGQPGWATTLGMEMKEPSDDDLAESAEPAQTGPLPSWLEPGEPPPFEAASEKELREEMENQAAGSSGDLPGAGFVDDIEAETPADEDFSEPEPDEEDSERRGLGFAAAAAGIAASVLASGDEEETDATADSEAEQAPESEAAVAAAAGVAAGDLAGGDEKEAEATADSEAEITPGGEIPDWMQEAGWGESTGEFEDAPVSFSEQELDSVDAGEIPAEAPEDDDVELTPAELPDWIHDIAPEEVEGGSDGVRDESLPSWIGAEAPSDDEPVIEAAPPAAEIEASSEDGETEASFPAAEPDTSKLPTWITNEPPGATETIVTWLEDRGTDSLEEGAAASDDLPDWMRDTGPLDDSQDPGQIQVPEGITPSVELPMEVTVEADDDAPTVELPMEVTVEADEDASSAELPMEVTVEADEDASPAELPMEEPASELPEEQGSDSPSSESWLSAVAAVAAEEESSPSSPAEKGDQAPDWLSETMETPDESESGVADLGLGLAAATAAGMMTGKDDDKPEPLAAEHTLEEALGQEATDTSDQAEEQDISSFAPGAEATEMEDIPSIGEGTETSDPELAGQIGTSEQELVDKVEPSGSSSAPDWLEEIGTLPEQPTQTDSADWLEGIAIDGEESPVEPAPETPDWLKGLAEEGADGDDSGAATAADWLREIGEPGSVSEEQAAEVVDTSPPDEHAEQPEVETAGGAPDWLPGAKSDEDEEALEQAEATPEPDDFEVQTPVAVPAEEDDEVMDWLQDLAAKQAEAPDDEELEAAAQVSATAQVLEDRDIPDEPEEGLEWLEQLADQRGMDIDVSAPGQTAPPSIAPEPEPESDAAPGWLGRMATQPSPKVDMEALEAAAHGEGIDPDAETIDAQAADIQAQLDEVALEREVEREGLESSGEVAHDDTTIEARAGDLQAEIEQEAEPVEPMTAASDDDSKDEIPDWLIAAAEQAEPPSEAPSGLPAAFIEAADELESEVEPVVSGEQEIPAESDQISEPAIVEDMEPNAPETEPVSEDEELQEIQPSEGSTEEVEVEWLEAEQEPAGLEDSEQVEPSEVKEPTELVTAEEVELPDIEETADLVATKEVELPDIEETADLVAAKEVELPDIEETAEVEVAEETEPISEESPAPEAKKKEELLERSRQALASGDTQLATEMYSDLVKRKESLDSVIEDLRIAVDRTPDNVDLWQVLGDAYMRDDQTDEAIDAYRKGMEAA